MIEAIVGNRTAERVLLHIYHYGEIHAAAIASDYGTVVNPIRLQLERFENGNIFVSKAVGRTRLYSFNQKSPYVKPLMEILKITYEAIPLKEREQIFNQRRRPRKKGKMVLNGL